MKEEYAPGIPDKEIRHELPTISKPKTWEYGVHRHHAERRGTHLDLRLGDPATGHAHSWALDELPKPGEATWAAGQPTHTVPYMDFKGEIPEGYGKGKVELAARSKAEVTNAEPGHISFNLYKSTGPEEYTLHRVKENIWRLYNRTPTRAQHEVPTFKPEYKEQPIDKIDVNAHGKILSAKIDDAHNLVVFPEAGKKVRVFSYRVGKKSPTTLIEHTHKIPGIAGLLRSTPDVSNTIVRGGIYAIDPKTGKATAPENIGGMLNSDVWKSREKQKEHGKLRIALYDVVKHKGKDLSNAPYSQKLDVLKALVAKHPGVFHLPTMAETPAAKRKLLEDIAGKKLPETEEGVVEWDLNAPGATKSKLKGEHDVYVRTINPGTGKYERSTGNIGYSHTPNGPIVGAVGSGLSDAQREHMAKHPKLYEGLVARVHAMAKKKSGALYQPTFQGFHLDKNEQGRLDRIKLAFLKRLR